MLYNQPLQVKFSQNSTMTNPTTNNMQRNNSSSGSLHNIGRDNQYRHNHQNNYQQTPQQQQQVFALMQSPLLNLMPLIAQAQAQAQTSPFMMPQNFQQQQHHQQQQQQQQFHRLV
jgi:DNA polymerase III alpha subunit